MEKLFLFIIGTAFGSFLNVLADRLPKEQSIAGRSRCDHCKKKLQMIDLIPLVSFAIQKGRCRYCHRKISWQYPLAEFLTGLMFILTWYYLPAKNELVKVMNLGLVSSLIVIFFADLKYQIIPDEMQLSFFTFALASQVAAGHSIDFIAKRVTEGLIVMLPMLIIFAATRGRGMGFGDVKLAFILGFFLGIYGGFISLYLAFVLGAIAGVTLIIFKLRKLKSKIAFGPFLIMGTLITIFFRTDLYIRLFYILYNWGLR